MKKVLIIIASLIILGCGEKVEIKTFSEKNKIANSAIVNNDDFSQKEIDIIILKLKEQMKNDKLKDKATKEYNDWLNAIYYAEIDKKKIEKEKKNDFFEEIVFLLIKDNLRDPDSYVLENILFTEEKGVYKISHYYRAKNGFGGYVKGKEFITLKLTQEDFDKLPKVVASDIKWQQLKERMEKTK